MRTSTTIHPGQLLILWISLVMLPLITNAKPIYQSPQPGQSQINAIKQAIAKIQKANKQMQAELDRKLRELERAKKQTTFLQEDIEGEEKGKPASKDTDLLPQAPSKAHAEEIAMMQAQYRKSLKEYEDLKILLLENSFHVTALQRIKGDTLTVEDLSVDNYEGIKSKNVLRLNVRFNINDQDEPLPAYTCSLFFNNEELIDMVSKASKQVINDGKAKAILKTGMKVGGVAARVISVIGSVALVINKLIFLLSSPLYFSFVFRRLLAM